MNPTADTTMDEPRPATTEFHHDLRNVLYDLGEEYGVTGFETIGVLSYLAAEINADNLAADGLLARGAGFQTEEPTTLTPEDTIMDEPRPATDEPQPASILEELMAGADRQPEPVAGPVTQEDYIAGLKFKIAALEKLNKMWINAFDDESKAHEKLKQSVGGLPVEQEPTEPEPATPADQPIPSAEYIAELEAKLEKLEQDRGARIDERDELFGRLEKAEAKVEELEDKLRALRAQRFETENALEYSNAELEAKVEELEIHIRLHQADAKRSRSAENALENENARLTAKVEELEEQVKDLQVMRDSLINSGISKSELCEQQAKRIAELEANLAKSQAMHMRLGDDYVLMGKELSGKVDALTAENDRLTAERGKAEAKVEELEDTTKKLRFHNRTLNNNYEKMVKKANELESALAESRAMCKALDRDLVLVSEKRIELGEKVDALAEENTRLTSELQAARSGPSSAPPKRFLWNPFLV